MSRDGTTLVFGAPENTEFMSYEDRTTSEFQGPGYVEIEGPFEMPPPVEWLHSPLVTRYSFEARHGWTRLVLEMVPGAQTNVACELLPNGPFATRRVDLSYHKPEVSAPWTEVGQP